MTLHSSTKKIVVPMDGSASALRALAVAIGRCADTGAALHLLNVQSPIASGNVRMFVTPDMIKKYHEDEARQALAPAIKLLESAKAPYVTVLRIGHPAQAIADHADPAGGDEIIMGTRGMSTLGNLVMGSVATQVVHAARVPVTLVK